MLVPLLAACRFATAAAPRAGDEGPFLADLPVVLTPSRLPQPLREAPAAVTVIDRDLIEATGYRDLARLLRLVPGMQVGQERGNAQWVTYHGMGNDFPSLMQVLVDGRSVYSPSAFGGVDWTGLPVALDEVERIEVVRGTDPVAYGSNAFLGVINIITRRSDDATGARLAVDAGNSGIGDLRLEASAAGPQQSLRAGVESRADTGFRDLHDSRRFATASLRADQRLGDHDELMLRLAGSRGRRDFGYADSTFGNNGERSGDSDNVTLHLQWRHAIAAEDEWLLHYYRNEDRQTESWTASALRVDLAPQRMAFVPLDRNRSSIRDDIELQHRLAVSATLRAVWGVELRHDAADSPFLFYGQPQQHSDLGRVFGHAEWSFHPHWSLNAGLLGEKFSGEPLHLSPRLFANWLVDSRQAARFGYARAWRVPGMFERYGDIRAFDPADGRLLVYPYLPNPDLRASRMDSVEAGYLRQFPAWKTRLDLRAFVERIDDFVIRVSHPEVPALLANILPSSRYENLGVPVTLHGIEYQLDSRPLDGTRLLFSHTLIGRNCSDAFVTRLTAPYTASLSWFQDWRAGWTSTLTLLRMGPLAGGDGFVPRFQYEARAYTTLDARVARAVRFGGTPAEVALAATNLGGRHQEIADRSEQFLHGSEPVNRTSPMVWLTLTIRPR